MKRPKVLWNFLIILLIAIWVFQPNQYIIIPRTGRYPQNDQSISNYYVDSINGSDQNSGASQDVPFKTLEKVNSIQLKPGNKVYFKRDSVWNNWLDIHESGQPGNPISYMPYGEGKNPLIGNSDTNAWQSDIRIDANWIVIDGFQVNNQPGGYGVWSSKNSSNNIITNIEATNVCKGVVIKGKYNLITKNHFHDLTMCVNTPGGNDDFGAVGVDLQGPDNEVSYNRMENCKAPSYDYFTDGGAVELYGNVDRSKIHHNLGLNNNGFIEVGSDNNSGSANDVRVFYNTIYNSTTFIGVHTSGKFGVPINNSTADNNTFVDIVNYSQARSNIFYFDSPVYPDMFIMRNNIFYIKNYTHVADAQNGGWNFTHQNNLYFLDNSKTQLGYTPESSEIIADPSFKNLDTLDFHLQNTSPAIKAGIPLGDLLDFDNNPVLPNTPPNIGAFNN